MRIFMRIIKLIFENYKYICSQWTFLKIFASTICKEMENIEELALRDSMKNKNYM